MISGWWRWLYIFLGCIFVGLGYLGVILPGIPATPFLLTASYFFVRSSPRLHRWLRNSPIFGRFLRDWETHRGVRRSVKIVASLMVVTAVSLSIALTHLPVGVKVTIGILAGIGLLVIWCLPTIPKESI